MFRGIRQRQPDAVRFFCHAQSGPNSPARSVPRPALPWSHRLRGGADGSMNSLLIQQQTQKPSQPSERSAASASNVNMTISLAFLAPDLVKAAIDGRLPHGMGESPVSATCQPSGRGSVRCSDFPRSSSGFQPGLRRHRAPPPGNGISVAQRQKRRNGLPNPTARLQRPSADSMRRQFGAVSPLAGKSL